jgi:hypothetical protein
VGGRDRRRSPNCSQRTTGGCRHTTVGSRRRVSPPDDDRGCRRGRPDFRSRGVSRKSAASPHERSRRRRRRLAIPRRLSPSRAIGWSSLAQWYGAPWRGRGVERWVELPAGAGFVLPLPARYRPIACLGAASADVRSARDLADPRRGLTSRPRSHVASVDSYKVAITRDFYGMSAPVIYPFAATSRV